MNHNYVSLGGNLTRDIETKSLPSGMTVADFAIAINRTWKDQSGEKKEEVTFAGCTAFGKTAENIAKYFSKGDPIFVQGRLKQDTWEDKETGKKMSKTKVVVESFEFIGGSKKDAAPATTPDASDKAPASDLGGDDVPF